MIDTAPLSRIIDAFVLTGAFVFNALVLDVETMQLAVAVGGSLSGSMVLAYFRRDLTRFELLFKIIASAIGGLVLGTVLQKYLNIEAAEYRLGLFFFCSMLALVVLRSLLSLTENNVAQMLKGILQRVFNLQLKEEKTRRRVDKLEDKVKREHPE